MATLSIRGRKVQDKVRSEKLSAIDKKIKETEKLLSNLKKLKEKHKQLFVDELHKKEFTYSVYDNAINNKRIDVHHVECDIPNKTITICGYVLPSTDIWERARPEMSNDYVKIHYDLSERQSWEKSYLLSLLSHYRNMIGDYKTISEGVSGLVDRTIEISFQYGLITW